MAISDKVDKRAQLMAQVDAKIEELASAVSAEDLTQRLNEWAATQATFHKYSLRNVLLMQMQLAERGRRLVQPAGFHTWLKMNRVPRKGTGLAILAPAKYKLTDEETGEETYALRGFKVAYVFDVADTEVIEGREDRYRAALPARTRVDGDYSLLLRRLLDVARAQGICVEVGEGDPEVRGWSSGTGRIWLNNVLTSGESCGTLLHELCHELCHGLERRRQAREEKHGKARLECEAEASAYCLCGYLNVPRPDSALYLSLHGIGASALRRSLEAIRAVVATVLDAIEDTDEKGEQHHGNSDH